MRDRPVFRTHSSLGRRLGGMSRVFGPEINMHNCLRLCPAQELCITQEEFLHKAELGVGEGLDRRSEIYAGSSI